MFYPLLTLLSAPTFRWNPWGYIAREVFRESLSSDPLGLGTGRKPKSRVLGLLGLGQAAGAEMRPQDGG